MEPLQLEWLDFFNEDFDLSVSYLKLLTLALIAGEKAISCLKTPDSCLPGEKTITSTGDDADRRLPFCAALGGDDSSVAGSPRCVPKIKTKKIIYELTESDDFDREEIATYEEVVKLYPRPGVVRPLVLIGPPGIGRNELKRRLMATNSEKFRTPTPCT